MTEGEKKTEEQPEIKQKEFQPDEVKSCDEAGRMLKRQDGRKCLLFVSSMVDREEADTQDQYAGMFDQIPEEKTGDKYYVDVDTCPRTAEEFGVRTTPTMLCLDGQDEIGRVEATGHVDDDVLKLIRKLGRFAEKIKKAGGEGNG